MDDILTEYKASEYLRVTVDELVGPFETGKIRVRRHQFRYEVQATGERAEAAIAIWRSAFSKRSPSRRNSTPSPSNCVR